MPWITEEKRRKCTVCGKFRDNWYQSPSADKPQPGCRQCHEERDRARREARKTARAAESKPKAQPKHPERGVMDIPDDEPITAAAQRMVSRSRMVVVR